MTSGHALHVEETGTGEPAVVLAHGFGGSARNFRGQVRALRDGHRVLTYDARGHARSRRASVDASAYDYSMDALVADLALVCARAVAPPVLVGLSLGAVTALRYVLRGGDVRALVLVSFPAPGDASPASWAMSLADAIDHEGLEGAGERFVWGGGRFDEASARFIRQGFLEHDAAALSAIARQVLIHVPDVASLSTELARITCPTLVVAGELDLAARSQGESLRALIPGARLEIVPGAGHVLNLQKPEQFNTIIRRFLSEF